MVESKFIEKGKQAKRGGLAALKKALQMHSLRTHRARVATTRLIGSYYHGHA